jgi:hypothetical protein
MGDLLAGFASAAVTFSAAQPWEYMAGLSWMTDGGEDFGCNVSKFISNLILADNHRRLPFLHIMACWTLKLWQNLSQCNGSQNSYST